MLFWVYSVPPPWSCQLAKSQSPQNHKVQCHNSELCKLRYFLSLHCIIRFPSGLSQFGRSIYGQTERASHLWNREEKNINIMADPRIEPGSKKKPLGKETEFLFTCWGERSGKWGRGVRHHSTTSTPNAPHLPDEEYFYRKGFSKDYSWWLMPKLDTKHMKRLFNCIMQPRLPTNLVVRR